MLYSTMVEVPMYRQLYASHSLSLEEWERRFIERASRAKKEEYKKLFTQCHKLIFLAKSCGARYVSVKSFNKHIRFVFDFYTEDCMNYFSTKLADKNFFKI